MIRLRQKKEQEKGNILMLCIVALAIVVSLTNILAATVISRGHYVRKVADLNVITLKLEDANIQCRKEYSFLQAETVELVQYYFNNGYYNHIRPATFDGPDSHHDEYLKKCVGVPFQSMIRATYTEYIEPNEKVEEGGDITMAQSGIEELAKFLYVHILSYRMSNDVPKKYSITKKIEEKTSQIKKEFIELNSNFTLEHHPFSNRNLYRYTGVSTDINGDTLSEYYQYYQDGGQDKTFAGVKLRGSIVMGGGQNLGISSYLQEAELEFLPAWFTAEYNGISYTLTETLEEKKTLVKVWVSESGR